mmetsp:Transcript_24881/g.47094  ORF Transcript_24881/g.47094 Transcript_24881/m.47094 type:complete len:740 (+) Transcript_24881:106-2325(+)|eukprot:CAMPEP_0114247054 /NCGR_PEP_ID=MMETSP0058-20121206/12811_1 /TAXON_ID=36894 /ORGANISM="Pyramimonas parkeae, CCMP726" /LENGTH=739 /DNA_ID=CAMNT_0001360321 /DNA_START=86 /DNA_END=2305 /DNA_ORIENTATION=-
MDDLTEGRVFRALKGGKSKWSLVLHTVMLVVAGIMLGIAVNTALNIQSGSSSLLGMLPGSHPPKGSKLVMSDNVAGQEQKSKKVKKDKQKGNKDVEDGELGEEINNDNSSKEVDIDSEEQEKVIAKAELKAAEEEAKKDGCPDVPEFFAVTGFKASGTRQIALMLDKAGVFMATGNIKCNQKSKLPSEACARTPNDADSDCSDNHLDFDIKDLPHLVADQKKVCYANEDVYDDYGLNPFFHEKSDSRDEDDDDHNQRAAKKALPYGRDKEALEKGFTSAHRRAKRCSKERSDHPWHKQCISRAGIKSHSLMYHVPTLAATEYVSRVIFVVRDGRDLVAGAPKNSIQEFASYMGMPMANGVDEVKVWAEAHLQALDCMQKQMGDKLVVVRIEDLMTNDESERLLAVQMLLQKLGLSVKEKKEQIKLSKIFAPPDGAPETYMQTHYGRWQAVLNRTLHQAYYEAAAEALTTLGYAIDPTTLAVQRQPSSIGEGLKEVTAMPFDSAKAARERAEAGEAAPLTPEDEAVAQLQAGLVAQAKGETVPKDESLEDGDVTTAPAPAPVEEAVASAEGPAASSEVEKNDAMQEVVQEAAAEAPPGEELEAAKEAVDAVKAVNVEDASAQSQAAELVEAVAPAAEDASIDSQAKDQAKKDVMIDAGVEAGNEVLQEAADSGLAADPAKVEEAVEAAEVSADIAVSDVDNSTAQSDGASKKKKHSKHGKASKASLADQAGSADALSTEV